MNLKDKRGLILFFFLIISLLIHLIFSFFFLEFGFKTRVKSIIKNLCCVSNLSEKDRKNFEMCREKKCKALQKLFDAANKEKKSKIRFFDGFRDNRPARLVAPKSNFGWVIFDDNYKQPEKLEIPTTKNGDVAISSVANATELKLQKIASKEVSHIQDKNINKKSLIKKLDSSKPYGVNPVKITASKRKISGDCFLQKQAESKNAKNIEIDKKNSTFFDEKSENKHEKTKSGMDLGSVDNDKSSKEQQSQVTLQERIKKIEEMQNKVEQYKNLPSSFESHAEGESIGKQQEKLSLLSSVLKKGKTQEKTQLVWGSANLKSNKTRNVIALTKGYIEKLDGEGGTDLIDRDGDPNKQPNFEEMKYISYEAKLNWSCQATWKQNSNFYNLPMVAREYRIVIGFTIGEKGDLIKSEILESSGCKEIDSAVIKNLEFTAPFPPLPKHFEMNTYSTGRIITVSINKMAF